MITRTVDTVLSLFYRARDQNLHTLAVQDGHGNSLTYAQLDERSTQLANHLSSLGVVLGEPIPLLTSSCLEMVVGVLGILKAGATYVPIDRVQWPQERINHVLVRCNAKIVLYTGEYKYITTDNCETVRLPLPDTKGQTKDVDGCEAEAHVMCIIFTSGTTNKPKAVQVRSSSVAVFVSSPGFNYDVCPGDRVLLVLSVAFDACMGTMFNTLCNGGTIVLADSLNFQQVGQNCNIWVLTPSILDAFQPPQSPIDYKGLKKIVLGGEAPSNKLVNSWSILNVPIWTAYGPTEATCAVLTECLQRSSVTGEYYTNRFSRIIPSGEVQLMDHNLEVVHELDREEEICILGNCLAAGYWMDEKRTNERFFWHEGRRIYRTGDLGKWVLSDAGTRVIQLLGRRDRVTKIRGFLVNLDLDVDASLLKLDSNIKSAFSLVIDKKLCTALASAIPVDEKALRTKWRKNSPAYMVPDHIFMVDRLPLTPNGKIDPKGVAALIQDRLPRAIIDQKVYLSIDEVIVHGISCVLDMLPSEIRLGESLVQQGLHSLAATKLASFCTSHGFNVPVQEIMTQPSINQLIAACQARNVVVPAPVVDGDVMGAHPNAVISFHKKLILASLQNVGLYCIKHISHYSTSDIPRLKEAWTSVVKMEPALRTVFNMQDTEITYNVGVAFDIRWSETAVFSDDDVKREISLLNRETGFGSLFRILNFQGPGLPRSQSMLIWAIHHALIDGFSSSLLFEKVDTILAGGNCEPSPSYALVARDLAQFEASIGPQAEAFWKNQSTLCPTPSGDLLLPERYGCRKGSYARYILPDKTNMRDMERIARSASVTPAAIFYTAWAVVLASYTGSDNVVFGAVLSGRNLPFSWAQTFVGALINTLPLRMRISRTESPVSLLQSMHKTIQMLFAICAVNPPVDTPRFSTALAVQDSGLKSGPTGIAALEPPSLEESGDLHLMVSVESDGRLKFLYDEAVISGSNVKDMASIFMNTITALVDARLPTIKEVIGQQLSTKMRENLLEMGHFNTPTTRMESQVETIPGRFYAIAAVNPTNIAVEKAGKTLTYSAMARAVSVVSHVIQALIPAGGVVGVLADRSINWIVAMFGALAANTTYCPLDASYAASYRAELMKRANFRLLLVPHASVRQYTADENVILLGIDQILSLNIEPSSCTRRPPSASDVAYLCFTSGSSGKPKGVLVEHRGVSAMQSSCPMLRGHSRPGIRIAQFMAPSFDGSMWDILASLCYGGTLVLRKMDDDPFSHLSDVDVAMVNPSVAGQLDPTDYPNLQYVYLGGEPVPPTTVDRWAPGRTLYNCYGPTEVSRYYVRKSPDGILILGSQASILTNMQELAVGVPVNVGPPTPTTRVYILNDHLELQPPGTMGNIYVAGIQVATGYLDMPEITAREFMRDPFATWSDTERMYRTGDLGFWDKAGNIHCCGRKDRQIKLRGYRINLDDISHIAHQCMETIRTCVATIENKMIKLWVEPADVCVHRLEDSMRNVLPPYAIPKRIQAVEKIPWTHNGKLDIKALAANDRVKQAVAPASQSATGLRRIIEDEWRMLLGLDPSDSLTGSDDFLERGGDSVLQLTLGARLKKIFGIQINPKDIIESASLDDMVALVESRSQAHSHNGKISVEPEIVLPLGPKHLSSAELWWMYRYMNSKCQTGFNVPYVGTLSPNVNQQRLASALETALNRHRILRSRFQLRNGLPERRLNEEPIKVSLAASVDVNTLINQPFDIEKGNLVRAVVTPWCLALSISHIVCDFTSLKVILNEVAVLYKGQALEPLSREYFDMTTWNQPMDVDKAQFWSDSLNGLNLHQPEESRYTRSYRGTSLLAAVPTYLYDKLSIFANKTGLTLHQIGLTVTGLVLHNLCQRDDILLGSPFINRFSVEDQNVVGLFLEPLPVRVRVADPHSSIRDIAAQVRQSSQSALANAVPWSTLLAHLGLSAQTDRSQIFDCVVTFHDDRTQPNMLPIDGVEPQTVWTQGSKFAMLFEWHARPENLSLRIEYDTDQFSPSFIELIRDLLLECGELVLDPQSSHAYVKAHLQEKLKDKCEFLGINMHQARDLARSFLMGA